MTDDLNRTIVTRAADAGRDARAHRWLYVGGLAVVLGIGVLAFLWLAQRQEIGQLRDSGNTTASQAQQLAQQVRSMGGTPVVTPATPGPQGPVGATGPGPTQAQIDDAVAAYLAAHPPDAGKPATPAMVATAVAEYLTANPPTPGRPPTAQEIATAAADYISAHSAQFTGPTGAAGKDATDAQVVAAVDAYCTAHDKCAGPAGATGKTGATGATGPPGPTCPSGYELRDAVITAPDGSTYQGKACVDPVTSKPPNPIPIPQRLTR